MPRSPAFDTALATFRRVHASGFPTHDMRLGLLISDLLDALEALLREQARDDPELTETIEKITYGEEE